MNIYLHGTDILGHGGGGGGHHHHHGGGGHGHGWGGPWRRENVLYPWDTDYVEVDDVQMERCIAWDRDGNCVVTSDVLGNAYLHGTDILGGDVLGFVDIQAERARMNALKPVTVSVARALLHGGQVAINGAITDAKQPWYKVDLPGDTQRQKVLWKLKWHQDQLAPMAGDPNRLYKPGEDLKTWAMQAFIEGNAVEEGARYLENAWQAMWAEIQVAIAAIPAQVRQALISAASGTVEAVTGIPLWGWSLIALGTVAGLGWIVWKLANSKAGAAAAHVAARRYLP